MPKRSSGLLQVESDAKKSKIGNCEEVAVKFDDLETFSSSDESLGNQEESSSSSFEKDCSSDSDRSDILCDNSKPVIRHTWRKANPPETARDIKSKFSATTTGPCKIENCKHPVDFFSLFLSESVYIMMVHHTNAFAKHQLQKTKITQFSRYNKWTDITIEEMKKFISILIGMGITRRAKLTDYWNNQPSQFIPFFNKVMTVRRFQTILAMFHLTSDLNANNESGHDLLKNVHELMTILNVSFKDYFVPGQAISVSESLIGAKKHNTSVQYVPTKNLAQHNIKKIDLCDSPSGYVYHSTLIKFRDRRAASLLAKRVVMEALNEAQLLGKGHHIFTDKCYTSFGLSRDLLAAKTFLTGILSKKSSEFESSTIQAPSEGNSTLYFRKGAHLLVKYKPATTKRTLNILTTGSYAENKTVTNMKGKKKNKPLPLYLYNQHKVVMESKRVRYLASPARMTRTFWKRIVYNIIDIALMNSFILYKANTDVERRVGRLQFVLDIMEKLSLQQYFSPAIIANRNIHQLLVLPGVNVRLCEVCRKQKTRYFCPGCNVGVHPECFRSLNHYLRGNR